MPTLVQSASGTGATQAYGSNVSSGTTLIIVFGYTGTISGPSATITDTKLNTWTNGYWVTDGTHNMEIWSAPSGSAGADTVSAVFAGTGYNYLCVMEWSGLSQTLCGHGSGTSSSGIATTGAVTPSANGIAIVGYTTLGGGVGPGAGFTEVGPQGYWDSQYATAVSGTALTGTGSAGGGSVVTMAMYSVPGAAAPNPQASFPDSRGRTYSFAGHTAVSAQRIDPGTFMPTPGAIWSDRGFGAPFRPDVPHAQRWIAEATFQPNPTAICVDRGTARPWQSITESTQYIATISSQNPQAIYPDRFLLRPWTSIDLGAGGASNPPAANPSASWIDRGAIEVPDVASMLAVANQFIAESTFQPIPSALYNDRGTARPWQNIGFWANEWIAGSTYQPNPGALYSDRGYAKPPPVDAFSEPTPQMVNPASSPPNPGAVYPDHGYGVAFRPDAPLAQRWIAESTYQPVPGALWSDRGYGLPFRALTEATPYVTAPPTVTPLGSWPDRGHAVAFTYAAHYIVTSQWINPALDQPNPGALWSDRGYGLPFRALTEATPYVAPPPAQVPLATWVDKGHAQPTAPGVLFFTTSQRIDPATFQPTPEAIFPDLGTSRPVPRAAFEPPTPKWIAESLYQPTPGALWADRGYGVPFRQYDQPPQHVTPPTPFVPVAVFADRGHAVPTTLGAFVFEVDRWIDPALDQPIPSAVYSDRGYARPTAPTAHELFQFFISPPSAVNPSAIYPLKPWPQTWNPAAPSWATWAPVLIRYLYTAVAKSVVISSPLARARVLVRGA